MKFPKINLYMIIIIIIVLIIILLVVNQLYAKKESFLGTVARSTVTSSHSSGSSTSTAPTTSQSNSSGSKSGGGCFSKDTLLQLEDGSTINITDAKIGDKILSYSNNKLTYSPIIAIPHPTNNILSKFIEIKTSTGKNIKMTESHLIPILKNNILKLIQANDIELNNIIITVDGFEFITDINISYENGIYTVVTTNDYIVVNNIIASPFAISHIVPSFYYLLHKIIYNIDSNLLESESFQSFNNNTIDLYNHFYNLVCSA
jgi:hypothetical protein